MISSSVPFEKLLNSIAEAQTSSSDIRTIYSDTKSEFLKNNALFFIKPEITREDPNIRLREVLRLILDKITENQLRIHSIRVLPAAYLKKHDLIRRHYGVISQVAAEGKKTLGDEALCRFKEVFGLEADEAKIMGGLEFMEAYPFFNAHSLDCLWQNGQNHKLAGGTYAEKWRIDLETVYVLNAFHPKQLEHFTQPGRCIVVMNISADKDWTDLRNRFAGATNPRKAMPGSLRNELYLQAQKLGLAEISQSYNGIHLSAGPVEALLELQRFESDLDRDNCLLPFESFPFGQQLLKVFGQIPLEILHNQKLSYQGKQISLFDLTEEMNTSDALLLLQDLLK
jgi:nucleoside diphosphate kinase